MKNLENHQQINHIAVYDHYFWEKKKQYHHQWFFIHEVEYYILTDQSIHFYKNEGIYQPEKIVKKLTPIKLFD